MFLCNPTRFFYFTCLRKKKKNDYLALRSRRFQILSQNRGNQRLKSDGTLRFDNNIPAVQVGVHNKSVHAPVTFIMRWARASVCSTTSRWRRRRPSTRPKSSPLPPSSALTVSLPNYVSETRAVVASSTTLTVSARAREFWLIDSAGSLLLLRHIACITTAMTTTGHLYHRFFFLFSARDARGVRSRTALFRRSQTYTL